jgi:hypothetical protein
MQEAKYRNSKVSVTKLWPNGGFVSLLHIYIKINVCCINIDNYKHYYILHPQKLLKVLFQH